MRPLRVVVVDDEAPARRKLLRFLKDDPEISVVGEAANGRSAVETIRATAPDLLFLDVQMPDLDGFEVLRQLGDKVPQIVFVTAFDQYAIQAFDVHAFGYLLKPFDQPRFQKVLDRAKRHAAAQDTNASRISELLEEIVRRRQQPARLLVEQGERAFFVGIADIDWLESDRNYLVIHVGTQSYTVRGTLDSMEEKFDPAQFARINRSTIVRIDFIRELQKWFHGEYRVVLKNGTVVTWTRRYLGRHPELLQSL